MAKRKTISESEVQAIVQAEIGNADGYDGTIVSAERADNLNAYFGRPYGNEVEGRSRVVSRDVQQTVEWQMPSYMRIFTSGEDVVSFEATSEETVEDAKLATEYVNYIWNCDNHGFRILYEWIKDALISKVGIVKIYWDEKPKTKRKRYSGLDDETFAKEVAPDDIEVSEHTENEDGTHDLVLTSKKSGGRVVILNVPPEEFLISKGGRNTEDARLVGHGRYRTISDLRQSGFPEEKLRDLAGGDDANKAGGEETTRDTVEDPSADSEGGALDQSMRTVRVIEAYIKIDVDGDGIAEMRKVTVAGPGYTVLSNEAWEGPRPFATITPIIMPHRFWGMCPADQAKEDQLVKTTLWRQFLDNAYVNNNQREEVVADNIIDPDELLSTAPGRKIRVKVAGSINPIPVPNIGSQIIEALTYVDTVMEANTGVSQRTQGLASDTLSDESATQSRMMMSAAQGKIELMARVMAETGLKSAFRLILKLVTMYQKQPRSVKLSDGWKNIDASNWDDDMELKVSVGLGMGDREQQIMSAGMVGKAQQMLLPLGFISPADLKASFELGLNGLGLKGVERFATFPEGEAANQIIKLPPPGKAGPDPQVEMMKAQIKSKTDLQTTQMEIQADGIMSASEMKLKQMELANEFAIKKYQMDREFELKQWQIQQELRLKGMEVAVNAANDRHIAEKQIASSVHVGGEPG